MTLSSFHYIFILSNISIKIFCDQLNNLFIWFETRFIDRQLWWYYPFIKPLTDPFEYAPHSFQSNGKYCYSLTAYSNRQNFRIDKMIDPW